MGAESLIVNPHIHTYTDLLVNIHRSATWGTAPQDAQKLIQNK